MSDKVRSGEIDKSVCSCTRWEGLAVKGLIAESAYGGWEEPVSAGYEACCQVAEDAEGEAWPEGGSPYSKATLLPLDILTRS